MTAAASAQLVQLVRERRAAVKGLVTRWLVQATQLSGDARVRVARCAEDLEEAMRGSRPVAWPVLQRWRFIARGLAGADRWALEQCLMDVQSLDLQEWRLLEATPGAAGSESPAAAATSIFAAGPLNER